MMKPRQTDDQVKAMKEFQEEHDKLLVMQNEALEGENVEEYNKLADDLRVRMVAKNLGGQTLVAVKDGQYA